MASRQSISRRHSSVEHIYEHIVAQGGVSRIPFRRDSISLRKNERHSESSNTTPQTTSLLSYSPPPNSLTLNGGFEDRRAPGDFTRKAADLATEQLRVQTYKNLYQPQSRPGRMSFEESNPAPPTHHREPSWRMSKAQAVDGLDQLLLAVTRERSLSNCSSTSSLSQQLAASPSQIFGTSTNSLSPLPSPPVPTPPSPLVDLLPPNSPTRSPCFPAAPARTLSSTLNPRHSDTVLPRLRPPTRTTVVTTATPPPITIKKAATSFTPRGGRLAGPRVPQPTPPKSSPTTVDDPPPRLVRANTISVVPQNYRERASVPRKQSQPQQPQSPKQQQRSQQALANKPHASAVFSTLPKRRSIAGADLVSTNEAVRLSFKHTATFLIAHIMFDVNARAKLRLFCRWKALAC